MRRGVPGILRWRSLNALADHNDDDPRRLQPERRGVRQQPHHAPAISDACTSGVVHFGTGTEAAVTIASPQPGMVAGSSNSASGASPGAPSRPSIAAQAVDLERGLRRTSASSTPCPSELVKAPPPLEATAGLSSRAEQHFGRLFGRAVAAIDRRPAAAPAHGLRQALASALLVMPRRRLFFLGQRGLVGVAPLTTGMRGEAPALAPTTGDWVFCSP